MPESLTAHYKNSELASVGVMSAVYENRCYYFSDELGVSGIYSMLLDGTDVSLEIESDDVQRIQITDGILYYLDYEKVCYGDESSHQQWGNRFYSLKALDLKTKQVKEYGFIHDLLRNLMYDRESYRGIWDFYYLGNDTFLIDTLETTIPTGAFSLCVYLVKDHTVLEWNEDSFILLAHSVDVAETSYRLFRYKDFFLTGDVYGLRENYLSIGEYAIYDSKNNESTVVKSRPHDNMPRFLSNQETVMTGYVYNTIFEYDYEQDMVLRTVSLPEKEEIIGFLNNIYYISVEGANSTIYRFEEESFQVEECFTLDDEQVIAIKENYIWILNKNILYCRDVNTGEYVKKERLDFGKSSDDVKIERGGDWIFVKKFDAETEKAKLLLKFFMSKGGADED